MTVGGEARRVLVGRSAHTGGANPSSFTSLVLIIAHVDAQTPSNAPPADASHPSFPPAPGGRIQRCL